VAERRASSPRRSPSAPGYPRARARTRASLLTAARQVLADKGVDGVTIADIAHAAGVSPGTFYNYFADVPAVVDALVDELIGYLDRVLVDVHRLDLRPPERFAMAVDRLLRLPEEDPSWAWCLVRCEMAVSRVREALCARMAMIPSTGPSRSRPNRAGSQARRDVVAFDILIGALGMSMLSRLQGRADTSHNELVVDALLRAWGLPAEEARAAAAVVRPGARSGRLPEE
jgi:AcrR family transcriptional regulator